jgi:hypothetical protein
MQDGLWSRRKQCSWRHGHWEKKVVRVRSQELIIKSLTYRAVPEYLESLMMEGRVGNKLDSALTRPKTLFKVDAAMPQVGGMVGSW